MFGFVWIRLSDDVLVWVIGFSGNREVEGSLLLWWILLCGGFYGWCWDVFYDLFDDVVDRYIFSFGLVVNEDLMLEDRLGECLNVVNGDVYVVV